MLQAYVVGTFDTKGVELGFVRDCLVDRNIKLLTVDLSTSRYDSKTDVKPEQVAACHPHGISAVFTSDRGASVNAMADAFAIWIQTRTDVGGIISAGGSGGTSIATAGMRHLPIGVPKIMVSTVASGNVAAYVGANDIMMMYSVVDVQGLNAISSRVLGNAAHALAGMMEAPKPLFHRGRPAIGMTMFGVTTPCVQAVQKALDGQYECMVFHATGTGGKSMEKLADSGFLHGLVDLTTTEVADMIVGGIMPCAADRFGSVIRRNIPYVGSVGAVDMVNFGARETVPDKFNDRKFHVHNAQVTLMRTTPAENHQIGTWIGERLNLMKGEVRFLLPEGGVSMLDAAGMAFHDDEADRALFDSIEATVVQTSTRKIQRVSANINDPTFAEAVVTAFREIIQN